MEIKSASMMDQMLRQAIDISMTKKQMDADQQAMQAIVDMAKDVANITGVGGKIDLMG